MIKKIFIGTGVLVIVGVVVCGTSAIHHVRHALHWAKESVADSVPIEYQLEQAEGMINEIIPEIDASKQVVAQEQVEIRYLTNEIARLERTQTEEAGRIQARNVALKTSDGSVVIAGRPYTRSLMEGELRLALRKHQNNDVLLERNRRLLDARQRSLQAAQQKLNTVCAEKENLEIAVEQLRAQMRETQAMQASASRMVLDGSKLSEVQEIVARCKKRLDVAQQLIENDGSSLLESPVEVETGDVTAEVDRYFGQKNCPTKAPTTGNCGAAVASKN